MPTDLQATEGGDIGFTEGHDAQTVSGEGNAKQQIAAAVKDRADDYVGSGSQTVTSQSRLQGQIRDALRNHEYVDTLVDISVTSPDGEEYDLLVTITLASDEITVTI